MFRHSSNSLCWTLSVVMALAPMAVYAQEPAAQSEAYLRLLAPETFAAVVAHPQRVIKSKNAQFLPHEVIAAASLKEIGVDATTIVQVALFADKPAAAGMPPEMAMLVQFSKPGDAEALREKLPMPLEETELAGAKCFRVGGVPLPVYFYPHKETFLLVGTEKIVTRAIEGKTQPATGAVQKALTSQGPANDLTTIVSVEVIRDLVKQAMENGPPLPPGLEPVKNVPDLVDMLALRVNLSNDRSSDFTIACKDDNAAVELEKLINIGINMGQQLALAQIQKEGAKDADDPVKQASLQYSQRMSAMMAEAMRPNRQGNRLTFGGGGGFGGGGAGQVAVIGILVALLLPAIQAAREAARRNSSINNIKQIVLAMHNHHDARKKLPARTSVDAEGKPLLSWRVHLLPYLGENRLYQEFKLDEPWDSDHNIKLVDKMPPFYASPGSESNSMTHYVVPVGKGTFFEGTQGLRFGSITDGTSNTIVVLEADKGVTWTKPEDMGVSEKNPLAGLGGIRPGGIALAGFADGHVAGFSMPEIDPKTFWALLTHAGGETINNNDF